jgi:peptide-methionine (S)-S-oxide reductase
MAAPTGRQLATLAGGCFWCIEAVYSMTKGVDKAVSGYMGGQNPNPSYNDVCSFLEIVSSYII